MGEGEDEVGEVERDALSKWADWEGWGGSSSVTEFSRERFLRIDRFGGTASLVTGGAWGPRMPAEATEEEGEGGVEVEGDFEVGLLEDRREWFGEDSVEVPLECEGEGA